MSTKDKFFFFWLAIGTTDVLGGFIAGSQWLKAIGILFFIVAYFSLRWQEAKEKKHED